MIDESSSTALAVRDEPVAVVAGPRPVRLLRPIAQPAQVIEAQNEARAMVHQALKEGRDYGKIPGTGDKPSMLKPGAERVALAFGCFYGEPKLVEKEVDHDRVVRWVKRKKVWYTERGGARKFKWEEESGESLGLYRYVLEVPVIERGTGEVVGSGVGACSSMESKYVDRPRDSENTVLKMAFKRAMVAACLVTFGLSDEFTQDVEDMAQFSRAEEGEQRTDPTNGVAATPAPTAGKETPSTTAATEAQRQDIRKLLQSEHLEMDESTKLKYVQLAASSRLTSDRAKSIIENLLKLTMQKAMEEEQARPTTRSTPGAPSETAKVANGDAEVPGVARISQRIASLLQNEKLTAPDGAEDLAAFKARLAKADTIEALQLLPADVEQYVELPF